MHIGKYLGQFKKKVNSELQHRKKNDVRRKRKLSTKWSFVEDLILKMRTLVRWDYQDQLRLLAESCLQMTWLSKIVEDHADVEKVVREDIHLWWSDKRERGGHSPLFYVVDELGQNLTHILHSWVNLIL